MYLMFQPYVLSAYKITLRISITFIGFFFISTFAHNSFRVYAFLIELRSWKSVYLQISHSIFGACLQHTLVVTN